MKEFLFKPDAAILLCSDGLSDLATAAEIREIVERYDGDAEQVARDLVDAANQAGGNDNITAVFVAGSEFVGSSSPAHGGGTRAAFHHQDARRRPAPNHSSGLSARLVRVLTSRVAFLVYGFSHRGVVSACRALTETARPAGTSTSLGNLCSEPSNSESTRSSASLPAA